MLCIAEVKDFLAEFVMFIPLLTHDMVITPIACIDNHLKYPMAYHFDYAYSICMNAINIHKKTYDMRICAVIVCMVCVSMCVRTVNVSYVNRSLALIKCQ